MLLHGWDFLGLLGPKPTAVLTVPSAALCSPSTKTGLSR